MPSVMTKIVKLTTFCFQYIEYVGQRSLVFHEEGFEINTPSQCFEIVENANMVS